MSDGMINHSYGSLYRVASTVSEYKGDTAVVAAPDFVKDESPPVECGEGVPTNDCCSWALGWCDSLVLTPVIGAFPGGCGMSFVMSKDSVWSTLAMVGAWCRGVVLSDSVHAVVGWPDGHRECGT